MTISQQVLTVNSLKKNTGQTGFKPEYDDEKRNKLTEKDINRDKGSEPEKKAAA